MRQRHPDSRTWGFPNSPARALDPQKLKNWYDLAVIGKSRVAGRPAVIVSLTPRDQHRYGFELHLDKETAFLSSHCY
jgi:sigma-E factor negative regulatory protein RseB